MAHRVLHDRLEDEHRHERVARRWFDVDARPKPLAEADLLDLEIAFRERQLVGQPDLLMFAGIERRAQQLADARQRAVRRLDVAVHQLRDRMQRVEEKVRLQLRRQQIHARLHQQRVRLAAAAPRVDAVRRRDDRRVRDEVQRHVGDRERAARREAGAAEDLRRHRDLHERQQERRRNVQRGLRTARAEAAGQDDDERREERPAVPAGEAQAPAPAASTACGRRTTRRCGVAPRTAAPAASSRR